MAARIRHIALVVKDLEETANFYTRVFGLKRTPISEGPTARRVYLSDGHVNLALLQYKSAVGSGVKDRKWTGIHHFGFQCEDFNAQQRKIEAAGGRFFYDLGKPDDDDFERKFSDPNGIIFDLNWKGWMLTSGKRKGGALKAKKNLRLNPPSTARTSPSRSPKAAAQKPRPAKSARKGRSATRAAR